GPPRRQCARLRDVQHPRARMARRAPEPRVPAVARRVRRGVTLAAVRYLVHDVEAALPFYAALGFAVRARWGPLAIVTKDDLELWLSGPGTSAARPLKDGAQPGPGGWNRFVIEVDDLDATLAALRAAGVPVRNERVSGPGGHQALVADPSGNVVEL